MKLIRNAAMLFAVVLSISVNAQTTQSVNSRKLNVGSAALGQTAIVTDKKMETVASTKVATTQNETKAAANTGVRYNATTISKPVSSPVKSNGKSLKDIKGQKTLPARTATKTATSYKTVNKSLKKA
jgi:hypothetical protein